jgi:PKD repeat protein
MLFMKQQMNFLKTSLFLALSGAVILMNSCRPDSLKDVSASGIPPVAAFTMTQVAASPNKYLVVAQTDGVLAVKWDRGDGNGAAFGKTTDTLFFPDAGTYTVTLTAIGKGGLTSTATKQLVIATSDPNSGNLVQGGKFNPGDETKWTTLNISNPYTAFNIVNGKMVATGGSYGHAGIYQAITVQANKNYKFSMLVSGNGATDTWFEVYMGTTVPVAGSDYSSGGIRLGLNTWTGCGNSPFNGNLTAIACTGSLVGQNGVVRFTQSGTIYLLIKSGGSNLGSGGIAMDNIELRGM